MAYPNETAEAAYVGSASTQRLSAVPPQPSELEQALAQLAGLREMLLEAHHGLGEFIGRAVGEKTGDDACAERQVFNEGLTGKLRRSIDDARDVAGDIRALVRRLPSIG